MDEFDQATIEALQHYVYRLEDPRKSSEPRTFYVGKGQGNRAFQHARDALDNSTESDKLERIREILHSGLTPIIIIHRHGLDELTAFHVEAALIDAYGFDNLTNEVKGQKSAQGMLTAQEVAEFYHSVPINIEDPVILIKIEREWRKDLTAEQLYERTRRYWFISPQKKHTPPRFALAVARGIVRAVYRIERWEMPYPNKNAAPHDPTRKNRATDSDVVGRIGFIGTVAPEKYGYIGKSVRHLQDIGAQNPIRYVKCD